MFSIPDSSVYVLLFIIYGTWQLTSFNVSAIPIQSQGHDYSGDEEFHKEIKQQLHEHDKTKGGLFDRILLVNTIHKKWEKKYQNLKRTLEETPDDLINKVNRANGDNHFEGDIAMTAELQHLLTESETSSRSKRNAAFDRRWLWTTRIVPYTIDPTIGNQTTIMEAIKIVHSSTCIRFLPYDATIHKNYVNFYHGSGCYLNIGRDYRNTGEQKISIGVGCDTTGIVLHEITHALGSFHEQSRPDRNENVEILFENVDRAYLDAFKKYSHGIIDELGVNYDYKSIMHYGPKAFGTGGRTTIRAIEPSKSVGNTADTYSATDIVKINALYACDVSALENTYSPWSSWSRCDDDCKKSRQRFCFSANQDNCPGSHSHGVQTEVAMCTEQLCNAPIDGHWNIWSSWSTCSVSCDQGTRLRHRLCDDPAPKNGGKFCSGESTGSGICTGRRCNIGQYDVDFEDGWGMWYIPYNSKLKWMRKIGASASLFTGPYGDHTLQGQGHYIYVSSQPPNGYEDTAQLLSPPVQFSTPHCLTFYYYMYGSRMGTLKLSIIIQNQYWVKRFSASGDQGGKWHQARVALDITESFKLAFEVTLGGSETSDVALDDIYIDQGTCPEQVAVCDDFDYKVCGDIARGGECTTNAAMAEFCKISCGKCPDKPCKDDDGLTKCKYWALVLRDCFQNPDYMFKHCKKSCGICSGCADLHENCLTWASTGECQANPDYMTINCKASCGLCGDCTDAHEVEGSLTYCKRWKNNGDCANNPEFMMMHCQANCTGCAGGCEDSLDLKECGDLARKGECLTNAVKAQQCKESCGKCPDKPCKDSDSFSSNCKDWAWRGECVTNLNYMYQHCKDSCGICSGCVDLDVPKNCVNWASAGECQANPEYMHTYCKASCGLC